MKYTTQTIAIALIIFLLSACGFRNHERVRAQDMRNQQIHTEAYIQGIISGDMHEATKI